MCYPQNKRTRKLFADRQVNSSPIIIYIWSKFLLLYISNLLVRQLHWLLIETFIDRAQLKMSDTNSWPILPQLFLQ